MTKLLVEESVEEGGLPRHAEFRHGGLLRVILVLATLGFGYCFKDFSKFSNLVGSVGLTLIGFIFPVFLYAKAWDFLHESMPLPILTKLGLAVTLAFGVFNVAIVGGAQIISAR